ncbi:penicillin-binding protein 2 [Alphaproteobacteria bacterium]|nr:penicillin-binding protein 2 [Alphaproteobacteria bacterium]
MKTRRNKDREYRKVMSRRSLVLGGAQLLCMTFLGGRLYQLQVAQNNRYQRLSDRNQFDSRVVPPQRGRVFDREMRLLAGNAEFYELQVTPLYAKDLRKVLRQLAELIDLPESAQTDALALAKKNPSFRPISIRSDLTQRELARLAVRSAYLPGVTFKKSLRRIYPQGALTGHVTGYVSPITQREIDNNAALQDLPDLATGKIGVEYALESQLRGNPGNERVEVNARGRPIRVIKDLSPLPGSDIQLALDIGVQLHAASTLRRGRAETVDLALPEAQRAMSTNTEIRQHIAVGDNLILRDEKGALTPAESGAAVVMDIKTGEVLSLVSAPMYDPNIFTEKLLTRDWRRLNEHPRNPLLNRATSGMYAPGSTFKMVVGLAALEAGIINEKTSYHCSGSMELGNATFHCWREDGHGKMNIVQGLAQSCDVYFYEVALKTGIQRIKNMAERLGLGAVTGIDIPGEKKGIIPSHEWKLATLGVRWTPGETVVAAIGQGYVLATPLQLAVMTARIANGSEAVSPTLRVGEGAPQFEPLNISQSALRIVRKGMHAVTHGELGTARNYNLSRKYGGMDGKTGTVQVRRITKEQREAGIVKNIDRPWKERDHALFVAYAPVRNPRYAISVVVEHGGSGSSMAAPVAREIMEKVLLLRDKA